MRTGVLRCEWVESRSHNLVFPRQSVTSLDSRRVDKINSSRAGFLSFAARHTFKNYYFPRAGFWENNNLSPHVILISDLVARNSDRQWLATTCACADRRDNLRLAAVYSSVWRYNLTSQLDSLCRLLLGSGSMIYVLSNSSLGLCRKVKEF